MQDQLDLEYVKSDGYTVELRHGELHNLGTVRSTKSKDVEGALSLIEGFRDMATSRHNVTWTGEEVNGQGLLYGMAGEEVWQIAVVPPFDLETV